MVSHLAFLWPLLLLSAPLVLAYPNPLPPFEPFLNSPIGQARLLNAQYKSDFFELVQHYENQRIEGYCGVVTTAMFLNALPVPKPLLLDFDPISNYYNEDNVPNAQTDLVKNRTLIAVQGMSLPELARFVPAGHPGVSASYQHTFFANVSMGAFRTNILAALSQPYVYVSVNFKRESAGQCTGCTGHHSPIGAYHRETDSVLILDTTRYYVASYWIPISILYNSTGWDTDSDTGLPRGLLFAWWSGATFDKNFVAPTDNGLVLPSCSQGSIGATCSSNNQCLTGYCNPATSLCAINSGAGGIPCAGGNTCPAGWYCQYTQAFGYTCTQKGASGAFCGADWECSSGICTLNRCR